MKVGVMQPYFFPYIGYFQLVTAVKVFVCLDDVAWVQRGFVNRNRVLVKGKAKWLTVPMVGKSQNKKIGEVKVVRDDKWKRKMLKTVEQAYARAPFGSVALLNIVVESEQTTIAKLAWKSVEVVAEYLELETKLVASSVGLAERGLKGQERILSICKRLETAEYVNAIGGQKLYSKKEFAKRGIKLWFVKSGKIEYTQGQDEFVAKMSILDVLAWNSKGKVKKMVDNYKLI